MSVFSEEQIRQLEEPLPRANVRQRQGPNGQALSYIEGFTALDEANRILGHGNWSRETVVMEPLHEPRLVVDEADATRNKVVASYMCKVRIVIYSDDGQRCIIREAHGAARSFSKTVGEAAEQAIKSAETDATKRALATLGHPLGLALYQASQSNVGALPQARERAKPLDEGFDAPQRLTTSQRAIARRNGRGDASDLPV